MSWDDWQYVGICGFIRKIKGSFGGVPKEKLVIFVYETPVRQVVSKFFFDFSLFMLKLQWN